jgi:hypothetical protein
MSAVGSHFMFDDDQEAPNRTLHFHAANCICTGDAEANRMFRRTYLKPFVVPEKV